MILKPGNFYRTRHGKKAYVTSICGPDKEASRAFPVSGWVAGGIMVWTQCGRHINDFATHEFDLVEKWREPIRISGWVNVYPSFELEGPLGVDHGHRPIYLTKDDADKFSCVGRIACIYVEGSEND